MPKLNAVDILFNPAFEDGMVLAPASRAKSVCSLSLVNMFTSSSLLDGSYGCAVDNHPDCHNWSSGNLRIFPL